MSRSTRLWAKRSAKLSPPLFSIVEIVVIGFPLIWTAYADPEQVLSASQPIREVWLEKPGEGWQAGQ
jgi:hypothetical protein